MANTAVLATTTMRSDCLLTCSYTSIFVDEYGSLVSSAILPTLAHTTTVSVDITATVSDQEAAPPSTNPMLVSTVYIDNDTPTTSYQEKDEAAGVIVTTIYVDEEQEPSDFTHRPVVQPQTLPMSSGLSLLSTRSVTPTNIFHDEPQNDELVQTVVLGVLFYADGDQVYSQEEVDDLLDSPFMSMDPLWIQLPLLLKWHLAHSP